MPNMGTPKALRNPALVNLRGWPVAGFEDMRIFYLVQGEAVIVVRVLHGNATLTGFWKMSRPVMIRATKIMGPKDPNQRTLWRPGMRAFREIPSAGSTGQAGNPNRYTRK
jgi:hypothetical protein